MEWVADNVVDHRLRGDEDLEGVGSLTTGVDQFFAQPRCTSRGEEDRANPEPRFEETVQHDLALGHERAVAPVTPALDGAERIQPRVVRRRDVDAIHEGRPS